MRMDHGADAPEWGGYVRWLQIFLVDYGAYNPTCQSHNEIPASVW